MRKKRPLIRKKRFFLITFICSILIISFLTINIENLIKPKIEKISTYHSEVVVTDIINNSVKEVINKNNIEYSDLAEEVNDENNKISSIRILTGNLNNLQSDIVTEINRKLTENSKNEIEIPIGSISDSYILSGRGPKIKIKFIPAGSVKTQLKSEFTSAGINQSCHRIFLNVNAEVSAVFPAGSVDTTVSLNCILAETVIIGDVPQGIIGEI